MAKKNLDRFPNDFMLPLSNENWKSLECQIGIPSSSATFTDSRARDHLLVTGVKPASEFLNDLRK